MRRIAIVLSMAGMAGAIALGVAAAPAPARAQDRVLANWREHVWREHQWRDHEWREHQAWRQYYYNDWYSGPDTYYLAPGVTIGVP